MTRIVPLPRLEKAPKGSRVAIVASIAPGVLLFAVFYVIAMLTLVGTAFTDWSVGGAKFIGLDNFTRFIADDQFWMAIRNTAIFVLAAVVIQVPLATGVALILARRIRGWRVVRTLLFLPNMMPGVPLALVYVFVFNPRFGLLNGFLRAIGLEDLTRDWLFDVSTALVAVIATWIFIIGLFVVLILTEVQSLPVEVHEAAQLDGATAFQREWWITIPLIRPVVGTCMLLAALAALEYFAGVYVMTAGGPADQTMTLGLYSFLAYNRGEWGFANAVGFFTLVLGALIILTIRRIARIEESTR